MSAVTSTPNGFAVFSVIGMCVAVWVGWLVLTTDQSDGYELHEYDDGTDLDPLEAYEVELTELPARRPWLASLGSVLAHRRRTQLDLDLSADDPWFGLDIDQIPAGSMRDLWLAEPWRAAERDFYDDGKGFEA